MRTTLLGSLLDSLRRNASRGMEDVRLFEFGAVYRTGAVAGPTGNPWYPEPDPALPAERTHVGALLTGRLRPPSWREPEPPAADFFAAKGVLEALLRALRIPFDVQRADDDPFLHPGRAAQRARAPRRRGARRGLARRAASRGRRALGPRRAGRRLRARLGRARRGRTAAPALRGPHVVPRHHPGPRGGRRRRRPGGRVLDVVRGAGGALLRSAEVFDVYRGAQVGEGRASLAVRMEFRAADRTLTDDEVAQRREKIVAALAEQVGGELRG